MTNLAPGDLVEVVNTPPFGWHVDPPSMIGRRGVVVSRGRIKFAMDVSVIRGFLVYDVRFPADTRDCAIDILRKISGPPEDDSIPTLTEIVA
jgi:hypothetical protein